ncbi:MAG: 30S ribosomal protein S15 [Myxococcota bacterium]
MEKQKIIDEFAQHDKDVGSCQVQVALLTKRITHLTGHFKQHQQDNHSRTGLLKMVSRRKRLLSYLKRKDEPGYRHLIARLGLRK